MLEYISKRPFILCSIGCITASVLGFYSKAALLCFIVLVVLWLLYFAFLEKSFTAVFISLVILLCSFSTLYTLNKSALISSFDQKNYTCKFAVEEITYTSDEYYLANAEIIDGEKMLLHTKISVFLPQPKAEIGSILEAELTLFSLESSKYKASYYSENVFLSANSRNVKDTEASDPILSTVNEVRNYIKDTLFANLDYSEASTLCALIFGERGYFTKEFYSCVQRAGVSHVMVVSGMHLSIMVTFFTFVVDKLIYNRYFKAFIIVLVVLLLTALCGFTMSMLRAGITYLIMALAILLGRENTPENSLGAALCIILIISPFAIFSVALQLSVLSTFGILCVALPITRFIESRRLIKPTILLGVVSAVLVTLSATLLTLPVTIWVFGSISKVSVITNLLISFAVSAVLWIALTALILNLVSPDISGSIFIVAEAITYYINRVIILFGASDESVITVGKEYAVLSVILIAFIFWCLLACKKHINMIKLKEKRGKIIKEGGSLKCR